MNYAKELYKVSLKNTRFEIKALLDFFMPNLGTDVKIDVYFILAYPSVLVNVLQHFFCIRLM